MKLVAILLSTTIALAPALSAAASVAATAPATTTTTTTPDPVATTLAVFQSDFTNFENFAEEQSIAGHPEELVIARDMKTHAQNWFKAMQDRMIEKVKENASMKDNLTNVLKENTDLRAQLNKLQLQLKPVIAPVATPAKHK